MLLPCACQPVNSAPIGDGGGEDVVDFMPTYSYPITGALVQCEQGLAVVTDTYSASLAA